MNPTRRDVLRAGAGAVTAGSLAGCLDLLGVDAATDADGYAAFFPLFSFAEAVGGDQLSFEEPVGTGRMGHGWSPPSNLVTEVASTELFIYLDSPEFTWAQDIAETLERDHGDEIAIIDLLDGVEGMLLPVDEDAHDHGGGDDHDEEDGHGDHHDEEGDHEEEEDHNEDDGHDHEGLFYDPHSWLDPVIVQENVDRLAAAFADHDPDNAETYQNNAAAYSERVEAVHQRLQSVVAAADLDVTVLAGHDSFRYLERRYGFALETPTGVSADAEVSQQDVSDLLAVIDDNGIDTVLYDPFEAPAAEYPEMVDVLVENSQATDAEPLTPISGTTEEWDEQGWGWVEQMENLNIPSLEAALNPA